VKRRAAERRRADRLNKQFLARQARAAALEEKRRAAELKKAKLEDRLADALYRKYERQRKAAERVPKEKRVTDKGILAELTRESNPAFLNIGLDLSESRDLRGPFRRVSGDTPVRILERGRGGHRFLVEADYYGSKLWGWVDKDYITKTRGNPRGRSAFDKCVASVSAKGSAYDPRAVCAVAGVRKYGAAEMARRAAAGRRRAARGNPGLTSYWRGSQLILEKGNQLRAIDSADVWSLVRMHGKTDETQLRGELWHYAKPVKLRNPAAAANEKFEEFHGYKPTETIEVKQRVHFHKHVSAAGEMVYLSVRPIDRSHPERDIKGFGKDCYLTYNEGMNQLFIMGGDQSLSEAELRNFIGQSGPVHELETLGRATFIGYGTDKKHLGKEGGPAVYEHEFTTTNERGEHVRVKVARYPDVIYRVRDERMEFSGGSYIIKAEGIDK